MSLDVREKVIIEDIFRRVDATAANEVISGSLDEATVIAMFGLIRDVVRPLDPRFADSLIPQASEAAAAAIAAKVIHPQITEETEWSVVSTEPKGQP